MDTKVRMLAHLAAVIICLVMTVMNIFLFGNTLMGYLWLAVSATQLPLYFRARKEYMEEDEDDD